MIDDYFGKIKQLISDYVPNPDTMQQYTNPLQGVVSGLLDKYLMNQQGQIFPEAVWRKPQEEQSQIWQDWFGNMAMGATSAPAKGISYPTLKKLNKGGTFILPSGEMLDLGAKGHLELGANIFPRETGSIRARVTGDSLNIDIMPQSIVSSEQVNSLKNLAKIPGYKLGKKVWVSFLDSTGKELANVRGKTIDEAIKAILQYRAQ